MSKMEKKMKTGFVRLVGGDNDCSGHVEIHDGEKWKSVCASAFGARAAAVVCRELQCGAALNIQGAARDGASAGAMWDRELQCAGNEPFLQFCPRGPSCDQLCTPRAATWLNCTRFRLVNGSTACEGRVELHVQGTWGSLCASRWHLSDAHVLCGRLGCGFAVSLPRGGSFGRGTGPVWRDSFRCSGTEAHLGQCPVTVLGASPCSHEDAAAVVCSEFTALRLENSDSCSGRLQVFYNGTWGSVCSNSMTPKTVSLACEELGCGKEGTLEIQGPRGRVSGPAWLDRVECEERHGSFWLCPSDPWNPRSCDELRDVTHITCRGTRPKMTPTPGSACPNATSCTDRERIRAVGGEDGCSGRVELWHRGSWGTVCYDAWDVRDAEVACRQLGCGPAVAALPEAAFGEGTGPIWLEQVECQGTEAALQHCWAWPGDRGLCRHKEDVAVRCAAAPRTAAPTPRADPSRGRPTSSRSVSLPVIMCMILGALVCLLLALLAWRVLSARAERRGSQTALEPFPEAVYQEIGYSPVWEEQARFSPSGSYSEGSLTKLQPHHMDSEEEDGLGSARDVPVLPRGGPADGYDDAREVSDPGEDLVLGHRGWEVPRAAEEGAGPRDAPGETKLCSQSSAGAPGAEGDAQCLCPESWSYDDAQEVSLAHPPEDSEAVTPQLRAQGWPIPGPGEPVTAAGLGAAGREEGAVRLGEP
ncbi:antigen WC1.1-like [Colius striatus]|uniref:antigen WC1.1-like n=1 Tax=Colius striatus TaxID=57412 RepID=UPI002B1CE926|nr:antigen WC1.1-like [Colius striatus]